jgi:catechol 2,3-dioxygenase-like lactoylglutathione lyase family enzyme
MPRIEAVDHLILTVANVAVTAEWYARVLQMQVVTFEGNRRALRFGSQKVNLHEAGREFEPKALHPTPGSADVCFVTLDPLAEWQKHLKQCGVEIVEGPIAQLGALGPMQSIYLCDPDGNLIELATYL